MLLIQNVNLRPILKINVLRIWFCYMFLWHIIRVVKSKTLLL